MLCYLVVGRKREREREREMAKSFFSQGQACLAGSQEGILKESRNVVVTFPLSITIFFLCKGNYLPKWYNMSK
jgi:hypothetical protein